ncbi:photoreceptor cilium actin regulator [Neosynchiropus ocellatus]
MGCSPSKGNNFVTMNPHRKTRMLPSSSSQPKDQQRDVLPGEGNLSSVKASDVDIQEKNTLGKPPVLQRETRKASINLDGASQKMNSTAQPQRQETNVDKQEATEKKSGKKTKKNTRGIKGVKRKDKDKAVEQKVDFPEQLVKAHQAAYAFLNPNIDKYDAVLELLEQGTQTQESLQPMVAFMALSYEQTILMLEEIADEGEKVLKEYGDHLAWPSLRNVSSSSSSKSSSVGDQPPPDLLQQLLQYTTQRMRNVSQTVGGLGDSALEEAAEYFASVAQLLEEKLKVKQTAETRLMQLLTRIEMASLRKPGPEDCALFSEDSGIGGESESIAGSERRLRRESCGSSGTNRTTPICPRGPSSINIRRRVVHQISPSDSLSSLNSLGSTGTLMANERKEPFLASVYLSNDGVDETEEGLKTGRVRFNNQYTPLNRESQQPKSIATKRIENPRNVELTMKMKNAVSGRIPSSNSAGKVALSGSPKMTRRRWSDEKEQAQNRPQTAAPVRRAAVKTTPTAIERRSRSAESLRAKSEDPTLMELERTQKNLSQRLQKINRGKGVPNTKSAPSKPKKAQSPKVTPKRQTSGKRNNPISTQDQGGLSQSDIQKQESSTDVDETHEEEKKTTHFLVRATPPPSPPASPKPSMGFHRGRNSVKRLIDSFSQGIEDHDGANILGPLKGVRKCGVPVLPGLGNVEAALSAKNCVKLESASSVDLDSLPPPPLEVLMDNSFESAENLMGGEGEDSRGAKSPVVKRAAMSRLRTSVQSLLPSRGSFPQGSKGLTRPTKRAIPSNPTATEPANQAENSPDTHMNPPTLQRPKPHTGNSTGSQSDESTYDEESSVTIKDLLDAGKPSVPVPLYSPATSQPPPAVSKGRMLPSTPSTPHTSNRRLPSPHNLRRQPTPPSTASPPVYRKPPSPTETRRVLRSPSTAQKSFSSYAFKAPSPPASPKLQRREKSIDDSARSFNNARSVFCPASPTLFEAPPCPRPPQAWTCSRVSLLSQAWEGRGRCPVSVPGPRPFVRRSQSDRRPSLTSPRSSRASVAETCGSEPSISTQGLDDDPTIEDEFWGSQSDLSVTTRSASQPDLCVVGHAFHRD